jgi:hypothetical protein
MEYRTKNRVLTEWLNSYNHFIYRTISQAINKTRDFGIIKIEKGIYNEQIVISKPLSLIGINRPTLDPGLFEKKDRNIITINENNVAINGLTIMNGTRGIYISGSNMELTNISITSNKISDCGSAIMAENCNNSNISNNIIYDPNGDNSNYRIGIELVNCDNFEIFRNNISGKLPPLINPQKMDHCIKLSSCDDKTINQIKRNNFTYATVGIGAKGAKSYNETNQTELYNKYENKIVNNVDHMFKEINK